MKVLLQNPKTRVFFQGGTAWTEDIERAFDFQTVEAAWRFCCENELVRVRIVSHAMGQRNGVVSESEAITQR
jgi:hypothetical protein